MAGVRAEGAGLFPVPEQRIRVLDGRPESPTGDFVLYWMIANRRLEWNFALDRAIELAHRVGRPLVILEALRAGYRWASDRQHAFVLQGMAEHRARTSSAAVLYHAYVEPEPGAGAGLLEALAARACAVVTDWYPAFFLPRMVRSAAARAGVRFEAVDSCGLLPLAAAGAPFSGAWPFRRFLQKQLPLHLGEWPDADPLVRLEIQAGDALPGEVEARWPAADPSLLEATPTALASLPIDHEVPPVERRGGRAAALVALEAFLSTGLPRYAEQRNSPDAEATSGLSPWLHWGHVSAQEIFHRVAELEGWTPGRLSERADGRRSGWWGMGANSESFLDELITWRELGYGFCDLVPDHEAWESLPQWAIETLEDHAADPRETTYTLDALEKAETHDELWNAAQRQLRREGVIHNYLRMLWGKKILEWTPHPRDALEFMIELNNHYAIDGRDPNSYSGIFWVLGRFDRGWPERPVYGKVRSMSSGRTRSKVDLERYLVRFGA